jgi:hypothetical protein
MPLRENDLLIISYCNYFYREIALNWANALGRLGIDNYLIFSIDKECHEFLKSKRINSCLHTISDLPKKQAAGGMSKKMGRERFYIIKSLLQEGYDVVYSDLDAVWIKNPLDLCANFNDDHMIASVVQHAGAWPPKVSKEWGFTLCTGWFGFRACVKNIKFLEELGEFFKNGKIVCDQDAYNSYLLSLNPSHDRGVKGHCSRLTLPGGATLLGINPELIKRGHPTNKALVGHPVSCKTAKQTMNKLKEKNLWFLEK